jgi:CubicO group peptidase (beta-lactamase class C family)
LRLIKWFLTLVLAAVVFAVIWLAVAPPALIQVASAYSAKIVCSNVFIANREPQQVLEVDVQAPGHWLLRYIRLDTNREAKTVSAALLGIFGKSTAMARDGLGCTTVPDGNLESVAKTNLPATTAAAAGLWPEGEDVQPSQDPAVTAILDDAAMVGPGMRAVVVVQNGRIVGERYGEGFDAASPLLGWSMTKTINAAVIGTAVKAGKLAVDRKGLVEGWNIDSRKDITLADLMAMSSALQFNEDYGDVTDVTRMLFLQPDMASFAADKPLAGRTGEVFNYSSGTATLLSRIWQNAIGPEAALTWPRQMLFEPIGMRSAVFEQDESGTYVGSSFMYATARDWARFGQFMLNGGSWNGTEILPAGFTTWMAEPAPASNGQYGRGQLWLLGPGQDAALETSSGVPDDAYWLLGHDGQSVAVIPSKQLVVVRLGLTPSKLNYRPQAMVGALAKAFGP